MNSKKLSTRIIAACLFSYPTMTISGTIPDRGPIPFAAFDTNGDGSISGEEFNAARAKRMQQLAAEGCPMYGMSHAPSFADLDIDGDGKLSPEELAAGQERQRQIRSAKGMGQGKGHGYREMPIFEDFDSNKDGFITEQEFYDARAKRVAERTKEGRQMKGMANAPSFDDIDTDGDGKISPAEFGEHQQACKRVMSIEGWN